MYPFASLPANLAAFGDWLCTEHGFALGPGELVDAAAALEVVDLADERQVRHALRPILSATPADAAAFDAAFTRFFFPGPPGVAQPEQEARPGRRRAAGDRPAARTRSTPPPGDGEPAAAESDGTGAAAAGLTDTAAATDETATRLARVTFSPLVSAGRTALVVRPVDDEWRAAARRFVRRLRLGLSRRWHPAPRGRRVDLRRTWRASLQVGGELVAPRFRHRAHRAPRFVVLADGSRSMGHAEATAVQLAAALAGVSPQVEAFVFSTGLRRVTAQVRTAAAGHAQAIEVDRDAWGGGTRIGASLRAFLRGHGDRLIRRETVVIVASDGLDTGDPGLLRDAMRDLHRRAAAVVWLNPWIGSPGYEPTAAGMQAARPSITTLARVASAADLAALSARVRVRA